MSNTRIPTQKRSIEKKNKIIEKGFELMCEKGFHNTNTSEIAKYTNVSTGIIYQYFNDKKEIFIEGIKNYSEKIMFPMIEILNNKEIDVQNINVLLNDIIDTLIKNHTLSKKAHEELLAMAHFDSDIADVFNKQEIQMTKNIDIILKNNNLNLHNSSEKIHIIVGLIENFCHEVVYHKHEELNYESMKEIVIKLVVDTLNYN